MERIANNNDRRGAVRIWDAKSGAIISELAAPLNKALTVSASFDAARIVTTDGGPIVRLWNGNSGALIAEFPNEINVSRAQIDRSATSILVAMTDERIRIWKTKPIIREPLNFNARSRITNADFSNDGQWIAVTTDNDIQILNRDNTRHYFITEQSKPGPVLERKLVFSPDSKTFAFIADNAYSIFDANTGLQMSPLIKESSSITDAAFTSTGNFIVACGSSQSIRRYTGVGQRGKPRLIQSGQEVKSLVWSPSGKNLLTVSSDGAAQIIDGLSGRVVSILNRESVVSSASFNRTGKFVLTVSTAGVVKLWNASTGELIGSPVDCKASITASAVNGDGSAWAIVTEDQVLRLFNTVAKSEDKLRIKQSTYSMIFSEDDTKLLLSAHIGSELGVVATIQNGKLLPAFSVEFEDGPRRGEVSFEQNGSRVLVVDELSEKARLWSTNPAQVLHRFRNKDEIRSAALSLDGSMVLLSGREGVRLWSTATGQPMCDLMHFSGSWSTFSKDGTMFAIGAPWLTLVDIASGCVVSEALIKRDAKIALSTDVSRIAVAEGSVVSMLNLRVRFNEDNATAEANTAAEFAEALAGYRLNDKGALTELADRSTTRPELKEGLEFLTGIKHHAASSAIDTWSYLPKYEKRWSDRSFENVRWAKFALWFFSDPATQEPSPFASATENAGTQ